MLHQNMERNTTMHTGLKMIAAAAFIILTVMLSTTATQDYDKGVAAYKAGEYAAMLKEMKPLAEQGHAKAQNNLGVMYKSGKGVPQDYTEAVKWYRLAAEQSYAEAVKWYRLAAEQGHASAQYNLGTLCSKGNGVPQDNALAHMWYNIAAANGDDNASKYRDSVAAKMTSENIDKAQAMARECMASDYKNCGN